MKKEDRKDLKELFIIIMSISLLFMLVYIFVGCYIPIGFGSLLDQNFCKYFYFD